MDAIWDAVVKLYGEYGASHASLTLIDYDATRKLVILRTVHATVDIVRAALASITRVGDKPAAIHVQRVSGTINTLRKKIERQI